MQPAATYFSLCRSNKPSLQLDIRDLVAPNRRSDVRSRLRHVRLRLAAAVRTRPLLRVIRAAHPLTQTRWLYSGKIPIRDRRRGPALFYRPVTNRPASPIRRHRLQPERRHRPQQQPELRLGPMQRRPAPTRSGKHDHAATPRTARVGALTTYDRVNYAPRSLAPRDPRGGGRRRAMRSGSADLLATKTAPSPTGAALARFRCRFRERPSRPPAPIPLASGRPSPTRPAGRRRAGAIRHRARETRRRRARG